MFLRKILVTGALLFAALPAVRAQEWLVGARFQTYFDNREYASMGVDGSKTLFAARLTPEVGIRWGGGHNRLMAAVELLQEFGDGSKFLTEARPLFWYQYDAPRAVAAAGIFPRAMLRGAYGEEFFDRGWLFHHDRLQGVMGQYRSDRGFVEFAIDWEGMQGEGRRERFRILSGGEYEGRLLYGGYALSLLHFAKSSDPAPNEGIVDHLLVNPYGGIRFRAFFDFDIRLGLLQSMQRDRIAEAGWEAPTGGRLDLRISRWGFTLSEMLYAGESQTPFYGLYGDELYACCTFFGTREGFYSRSALSYARAFFDGTVDVRAGILFHCDGTGLGTQQVLQLTVRLQKIFGGRAK